MTSTPGRPSINAVPNIESVVNNLDAEIKHDIGNRFDDIVDRPVLDQCPEAASVTMVAPEAADGEDSGEGSGESPDPGVEIGSDQLKAAIGSEAETESNSGPTAQRLIPLLATEIWPSVVMVGP